MDNAICNGETYTSFRKISVHPSKSEILEETKFKIRRNILKGQFASVEQYLNIQFHLLREDFLATLREGIKNYCSSQPTTSIDVYKDVEICSVVDKLERKVVKIQHKSFQNILEEKDCKKFMTGSLLIFTKDNFKNILFMAKVARTRHNQIIINIHEEKIEPLKSYSTYTMAECCTFFEPYFQVMSVLKTMSCDNFPMERYIIQVDTSRKADSPTYFKNFLYSDYQDFIKWSKFNSAQIQAFKAALTQEFVVIQGPPGTGKTFLGQKIAEYLIKHKDTWYNNSPMLIISYKNHALDQFLENLIPITGDLIRVGGRSKSELLKDYNLAKIRKNTSVDDLTSIFSNLAVGNDFSIMKKALVIAMTTTAAARMKHTLEKLKCPIVIVEEAAEVLEAHVVAALTKNCQHLILLGDHQQLQPMTSCHTIRTKYGLGISLFERMVNNGIQCYKLDVQHRMRPEISCLLPMIYPFLKDHESVKKRPSILGVDKNVFFLNHQFPEEDANYTSKKNIHEVTFLMAFAKYLVLNCHSPGKIVILTTYSGQVEEFQKEMKVSHLLTDVKVSTLDAFQGQEADIVLLSLVRSEKIGFLAAENRISVALSRAKNGFYIMGNMDLLKSNSMIWSSVKNRLLQTDSFGPELVLRCQSHPETTTSVKSAEDFKSVLFGGCHRECDFKLSCGHKCRYQCHSFDKNHETYKCETTCERSSIPNKQ